MTVSPRWVPLALVLPTTALAQAPTGSTPIEAPASRFHQDRQAILAQVGQMRVRFDMRENVSLQHILVMGDDAATPSSSSTGVRTGSISPRRC